MVGNFVCMYGYGMLMSSKKSETIISPPKIIIQCTHFKFAFSLSGIISFYFQLGPARSPFALFERTTSIYISEILMEHD